MQALYLYSILFYKYFYCWFDTSLLLLERISGKRKTILLTRNKHIIYLFAKINATPKSNWFRSELVQFNTYLVFWNVSWIWLVLGNWISPKSNRSLDVGIHSMYNSTMTANRLNLKLSYALDVALGYKRSEL